VLARRAGLILLADLCGAPHCRSRVADRRCAGIRIAADRGRDSYSARFRTARRRRVGCGVTRSRGPLVVDITAPSFRVKGMLRAAFDHLQSDTMANMLIGNPLFSRAARLVFFHRRGVLSAAAWRDLLRG
jgi:hypothetical protein